MHVILPVCYKGFVRNFTRFASPKINLLIRAINATQCTFCLRVCLLRSGMFLLSPQKSVNVRNVKFLSLICQFYKTPRSSFSHTMTSRDDRPPAHAHAYSNHTYLNSYTARPFIHIWTDFFFISNGHEWADILFCDDYRFVN